jgi:predicted nucleic acid-binding protein
MGLILDSTDLIGAERTGRNAHDAIAEIRASFPGEAIGVSVISLMELSHGVARAETRERAAVRQRFLTDLQTAVPVYFVSAEIAIRAGELDGLGAATGVRVALADLLIGATALSLGYAVLTRNIKHFNLIPGLRVIAR